MFRDAMDYFISVLEPIFMSLRHNLLWMAGFAAVFTALAIFDSQACNPGKVWWRSRELYTDLAYAVAFEFISPIIKFAGILLLMVMLFGLTGGGDVTVFFNEGHGPLSNAPVWVQFAVYMLGSDLLLYWSHRMFHGRTLWAFHAVHHSPVDLNWTSTYRMHPINKLLGASSMPLLMMVIGIPPWIMMMMLPFEIVMGAFVHANLNWTFGPLKYVIATPVFHRWHHTGIDEGGEKNFAPTFPFVDLLFGTFYMPEGRLPENYGVHDKAYPMDFLRQMVIPFRDFWRVLKRRRKKPVRTTAASGEGGGAA